MESIFFCVFHIDLASLSQGKPLFISGKQGDAKPCFQFGYLLAQRGLRDKQALCSP